MGFEDGYENKINHVALLLNDDWDWTMKIVKALGTTMHHLYLKACFLAVSCCAYTHSQGSEKSHWLLI